MNLLYKITAPAVLFSALSLSACESREWSAPVSNDPVETNNSMYDEYGYSKGPVYVEGVVVSECFTEGNFLDGPMYTFGVETETEIKTFYASNPHKFNAVIKQGDKVRLRIDLCDDLRRFYGGEGRLLLEDLISVNGKKINW
jgi:hypothetical protein